MEPGEWLVLLLTVAAALAGLFVASGAGEGTSYILGLLVAIGAVAYAFIYIKRYFDRIDASRH
jgi:uncharacterized membrane protein HdeD (DUF308 family)